MIPIAGAFRGLFLGSVLLWYSSSVWKTMDNYYNQEFKKYMQKENEARRIPMDNDLCPVTEGKQPPCSAATDAAGTRAPAGEGGGGGGGGDGDATTAQSVPDGGVATPTAPPTHTPEMHRPTAAGADGADEETRKAASIEDEGMCPALLHT